MKTIIMPEELKDKWVEALRSGEYLQGRDRLLENRRFCCLGVLCDILDPENGYHWHHEQLPPRALLQDNRIRFYNSRLMERIASPYLETFDTTADDANDAGNSFLEIADAIEDAWEPPPS